MNLKNKKVLLMGLGILGGGVATARFLVEQGALLTITDLKDAKYLKSSVSVLKDLTEIKYILGEHREKDFLENEIIVLNPDVSINNKFVKLAKKNNKQIENELTLFYKFCPTRKIVAITGTRGKTTTANWAYHILKSNFPNTLLAGNSSENPFLQAIHKCDADSIVVLEVPSYQLELLEEANSLYAPKVAVITNIYQDHLNRHGTLEGYARTKANIFKSQTKDDFLILNKGNQWTNFLIGLKPRSQVRFFSPSSDSINLAASILIAKTMGMTDREIEQAVLTLPVIKWRQELVYMKDNLKIYNDTTATSPEATMVAIEKFSKQDINLIMISGGTDRELDYKNWAQVIKQNIKPENLILLSGSATDKMKRGLSWEKYNEFGTLEECLKVVLNKIKNKNGKSVIVFSPGAKSFEKFKNEFDRGEKFNELVNKLLK